MSVNHEQRVSRAAVQFELARAGLNRAILEASDAGLSLRDIARNAGLSHETVRKILSVSRTPKRPGSRSDAH